MKKYLLFFSFLFMALAMNAQSNIKEEVVETTLNKNAMWINLKKWVSATFESYKFVVDLEDKEAGILIIKWKSTIQDSSVIVKSVAEGTLQVDVRDNKFRIIKSNEYIEASPADINKDNMDAELLIKSLADLELMRDFILETKSDKIKLSDIEHREEELFSSMYKGYIALSIGLSESLKKQMTYIDDF